MPAAELGHTIDPLFRFSGLYSGPSLFQFPWTLEMGPYTSEGIRRSEKVDELQGGGGDGGGDCCTAADEVEDLKPMSTSRKLSFSRTFSTEHSDLSHPYELVGVVVHSGQANAGRNHL